MYENLKIEIFRLLGMIMLVVVFGWLSGQWLIVTWGVFIAYSLWQLKQIYLLERWIMGVDSMALSQLRFTWRYVAEKLGRCQKAARKRKRRFSRLLMRFNKTLEVLPDATVILDDRLRVQWLNAAATRLLGLSRKDIGTAINTLIADPGFEGLTVKGIAEQSFDCISPANTTIELEINIVPFGNSQFLLTAHDITEIKKIESVRREFVANVSHELRTPLTVIRGYLELLESEDLPAYLKDAIVSSAQQAGRMETLVSDLLMLSKLEMSDKAHLIEEKVDILRLLTVLQQSAVRLSGAADHKIMLDVEEGLFMSGNEAELSSAFGNLIFNAVLHTPPGTAISIGFFKNDQNLVFQVKDNGPGIERQHLVRLTERFYRVDKARSRERGGTGLGLSICKHVVQRHNGEIKVESEPGKGTVFSCVFPLDRLVTV